MGSHTHEPGPESTLADVVAVLAGPPRRITVATHRNPDGDAVGSMLGLARTLSHVGHDVTMWHTEGPGIPMEFAWLLAPHEQVVSGPMSDAAERVLVAVDTATAHRLTDHDPRRLGSPVLNIDHHHDNHRYGDLNLIDGDASSTAEMVLRIVDALGVPLDAAIALPLYVGVVTDTGRFSYGSTGAGAHTAAARLIEAGVDVGAVFRTVYEGLEIGRVRLMGRALAAVRSELGGRLIVSVVTDHDVQEAGSDDSDGIVEALRAIRGAHVAAVIRQAPGGWRVSMRASGEGVDVSEIARVGGGGGGHRAAAGFTAHGSPDEIITTIRDAVARQIGDGGHD